MKRTQEQSMRLALEEAALAAAEGEIPVGAVVEKDGEVVGRGHNRRERDCDPTAHAEIDAMRDAAKNLGDWRLTGCTLYGAADAERGTCGSVANLCHMPFGGQAPLVQAGVEEQACRRMLQAFFEKLRT